MLLARVGVGSGESSYGPAAWSIATDNWPREKVAFATGTMGIGAMVGTGLAMFLGGAVLHFVQGMQPVALPWGGVIRSWQWAFIVVGAPGLLWTFVVLTTREPPRRGLAPGQKAQNVPISDVVRWILGDWRTYLAVLGGTATKGMLMFAPVTWNATFLHRHFGWELSKVGLISGSVMLVTSPFAMLTGAKISEVLTKRGRTDANMLVVFFGLLCALPFLIVAPLMPNPYLVLACNAVASFVGMLGFGPGVAAFQVITPNRMRAQVGGLSQLLNFLIAWALAPLVVALFTDYLFRDPAKLGYSMVLNAICTGILALIVTGQGLRSYRRSYERAVRDFIN
jgi:MFS family permease